VGPAFYSLVGKSVITMDQDCPASSPTGCRRRLWREALHMVANGEATVEQIDTAITDGPGLRWPAQGPMLTFHLAAAKAAWRTCSTTSARR